MPVCQLVNSVPVHDGCGRRSASMSSILARVGVHLLVVGMATAWEGEASIRFGERPFVGAGHCETPVLDISEGLTHVRCLSPPLNLAPGDTADVLMLLGHPFPEDRTVVVVGQSAQLVDETSRPVPLSEVYVHHYVGDQRFIIGNGAELRGSMTQHQLPMPYSLVVDGTKTSETRTRIVNIQLINTIGVAETDMKECLECWCDPEDVKGSFRCCKPCPTAEAKTVRPYFLEHNVTYRNPVAEDLMHHISFIGYDVTHTHIEYDITEAKGPNSTDAKARRLIVDENCPQSHPFSIVRCTAHQHVGSKCMSLYNVAKDELICRSCPVYGEEPGVPGDEAGYVVKMRTDDVLYTIEPGTKVELVSEYDASEPRLGVMGLFTLWVADLQSPACTGGFGGHMFDIRGMAAGKQVYEHSMQLS